MTSQRRRRASTAPSKEWRDRHPPPQPTPPKQPPAALTRRVGPTYSPREPWPELPPWLLTAAGVALILLMAAARILGL
jgi:hypothetical protein